MPESFVLGTHNKKKCEELHGLLAPLGFQLQSLAEFDSIEVEETGTTFIENARLKASQQAKHLGKWTIGEDSDFVFLSWMAHLEFIPRGTAAKVRLTRGNNAKLLQELQAAKDTQRAAYYVCTIAVSDAEGSIRLEAEGKCWGRILKEERGEGGFGYDPLFEIVEYHHTFAELGRRVKSALSHRARALEQLIQGLRRLQD